MPSLPLDSARTAMVAWFRENFRLRGEVGASCAVWAGGKIILSLAQGYTTRDRSNPWTEATLVPVWSCTKGPAAVTCLMALEEAHVELDAPVAEVWPEFVGGGKAAITLRQLLSHTAGLAMLDERVPIFDREAVVHALELQVPVFPPGSTVAYHARTFGFLLEEIVMRTTGAESLGEYFREVLGEPLGLDFWIGLPREQHPRVATLYPGKMSIQPHNQAFLKAFGTPDSTTLRTFQSPVGLNAIADFNEPETWMRGYPAMGGVGSALALAQFYGVLANGGICAGQQVISPSVLRQAETLQSSGLDQVLCVPTGFSAGLMKDPIDEETGEKIRQLFGPSTRAFGHPGAGGSLAFADPESGIGFAYVMNQMEVGAFPGEKALGLVHALYGLGVRP
ncbi:MAG: beta-lactamase family protein [Verrucomicrobiales bacterium]|nr:beta-lactamase family protein [Verrucomicrobiales bacterium]